VVSFRYLVVTVVSIFLALALGILAGTTVLDQGLVKNLRSNTRDAERRAKALQREMADLDAFAALAVPRLVHGRLAHRDVVLVTDDNTDATAVSEARDFLDEAKAQIVAELHVRSTIAPDNTPDSALRQVLSSGGAPTGGSLSTLPTASRTGHHSRSPRRASPRVPMSWRRCSQADTSTSPTPALPILRTWGGPVRWWW
jgi:hypothetical protein